MIGDPKRTLTATEANAQRDEIYAALHDGALLAGTDLSFAARILRRFRGD